MLLCLAPMPYGYFQLVWFVAMVPLWNLLPKRLILVPSRKAHCSRINVGILREQGFDVLRECVRGVDAIEPVGDIAQMGIEFVGRNLSVSYPRTRQASWQAGCNNDIGIPKAGMMGTDVSNDGKATKPCSHIFKFWDHKASTHCFLGSTVAHVAVKSRKCSHRSHLHCFPYRRHRRFVILAEMLLNVLVLRSVQLFLQVSEIACKLGTVFRQRRLHKPESTVPFCKDTYHSGPDGNLYVLDGRKDENAQLFVKTIEVNYLGESGTWLECVLLPICLHQSPIASQTEIADGVKCVFGFFLILNKKSSLFQNIYLLLEGQQLFSVSHNRINKKCPALVRYIHKGREAAAGSIVCKGTTLYSNLQMFWRKSA